MFRWWWLGGVAILAGVSVLLARQGVVNTTDGRILRGDIQQNPDGTTNVGFRGGTVTLDAGNVASIVYADDARADFDDRLKKLDPNDITGRIELGRMELSAGQYELATSAAEDAQRLDPHNPDAAILLDTIQAEQTLNVRMAVEAAHPTPVATKPSEGPCLTQADVYAIRRAELTSDDNVHLTFHNDVRSRYASLQSDAGGFNRETEPQQAIDIIQSGDPNLAKDVHIETDPAVIREYRAEIQPKILEGCAAAGCHSGDAQGGFRLMTDASDTLPAYTNYFILQMSGEKLEGGSTFGHGPVFRPMIDRARVDESLLLQFGLPQNVAVNPHPNAQGFRPMFRGVDDPVYHFVVRWISSLRAITPDYGIQFKPSTGNGATTQGS
jgi:hypothetical protein